MKIETVQSSMISKIGHDPETSTLEIHMKTGDRYRYSGVDADSHAALMSADSIGKHYNQNIKGQYPVEKMS